MHLEINHFFYIVMLINYLHNLIYIKYLYNLIHIKYFLERFFVGQNLGLMKTEGSEYITKIDFSEPINKWFDEHKLYQFSAIDAKSTDAATGHYTQVYTCY